MLTNVSLARSHSAVRTDYEDTLAKTLVIDFHQTLDVEKFLPEFFALFLLCLIVWRLGKRKAKFMQADVEQSILSAVVVAMRIDRHFEKFANSLFFAERIIDF